MYIIIAIRNVMGKNSRRKFNKIVMTVMTMLGL